MATACVTFGENVGHPTSERINGQLAIDLRMQGVKPLFLAG